MSSIVNEISFFFKELMNYLFETISSLVFYVGIIIFVFWVSIDEENLSSFMNLKGYSLWMLLVALYSSFIMNVKTDISNKTLELLETMPTPYRVYLLKKSVARLPYDLIVMSIVFTTLTFKFNSNGLFWSNYFDVLLTFTIFIPFLVSISLIISSLIIAFKRAEIAILIGNLIIGVFIYFFTTNGYFNSQDIFSISNVVTYTITSTVFFIFANIIFDGIQRHVIRNGKLGQV